MMYPLLDEWTTVDSLVAAEPGSSYAPQTAAVDLAAYNPLTHRLIGCAMRVHSVLGTGFPEVIYQRALAIELEREEVVAQREVETPIYFRGQHIGTRRVDFLVAGPTTDQPILVELKATAELTDTHFAQIINYLEAYRLHVGLPAAQFRSPLAAISPLCQNQLQHLITTEAQKAFKSPPPIPTSQPRRGVSAKSV